MNVETAYRFAGKSNIEDCYLVMFLSSSVQQLRHAWSFAAAAAVIGTHSERQMRWEWEREMRWIIIVQWFCSILWSALTRRIRRNYD